MRKYIEGAKLEILSAYQYRVNTLSSLFFWNLSLIAALIFWIAIYKNHDRVGNYSFSDMISFVTLVKVASTFSFHMVCLQISRMVKQGTLSFQLLLPQNFFVALYSKTFGKKVFDLTLSIILFGTIICIIPSLSGIKIDVRMIPFFLLAIVIGSIISYLIGVIIGVFSFFIEEIFSIIWIVLVVINFLSGQFIPLDLFPKAYVNIIENLPFSSFGYYPTKILIGSYSTSEIMSQFTIYGGWICILSFFAYVLWKIGIKKYSAAGA